jgi:hypothetical protein
LKIKKNKNAVPKISFNIYNFFHCFTYHQYYRITVFWWGKCVDLLTFEKKNHWAHTFTVSKDSYCFIISIYAVSKLSYLNYKDYLCLRIYTIYNRNLENRCFRVNFHAKPNDLLNEKNITSGHHQSWLNIDLTNKYVIIVTKWKRGIMVFNATFNNISVSRGGQCYWWRKPEYPEKTIDLRKSLTNFIT